MNYLLDTCVLAEFTRHQPDTGVIDWLTSIDEVKTIHQRDHHWRNSTRYRALARFAP